MRASEPPASSERLKQQYRRAGVERVAVIPNHLSLDAADPLMRPDGVVVDWVVRSEMSRARVEHDGLVIGWIAGVEHKVDAERLKVADTLERLLARHRDVRVDCIGVDLRLPERYRHHPKVRFAELPSRIGGFDIGIAPLADIPWNRARSDIKLKEYAASGVPWLASPVGPYLGLGEEQGGRLVSDDEWFDALDRLITREDERRSLGFAGRHWAARLTIDSAADRWEQVFAAAAAASRA